MAGEDEKDDEVKEPISEIGEVPPEPEEAGDGLPEPPVFMREEEPTGKEDKAKYWILREPDWTDDEIAERKNLNVRTVNIARSHLADDGYIRRVRKPSVVKKTGSPGTAVATQGPGKGLQVFAKGAAPEAIIESITIPMVDGQSQGFEQGMKFGMTQLVLAVRVMQELSAIGLQQVKPLIDMTRSVREGEQAAFKGGAEEGAMKAARAMGETILPMMSEMQANIAGAAKGNENDPMKSMMVRTMEPLMKRVMGKLMPGMQAEPPSGWSKRSE